MLQPKQQRELQNLKLEARRDEGSDGQPGPGEVRKGCPYPATTQHRSSPFLSSLSPPTMADIIQSFPPELLIEVLIHIPVPDVLGLKQVK